MNTAHQTTSTSGSGACNSMTGGGPGHRVAGEGGEGGLVFSGVPMGARFLDLTFGSWWIKTGENSGTCDEYEDSAFSFREVAGFGLNEAVSLTESVYQSVYQN